MAIFSLASTKNFFRNYQNNKLDSGLFIRVYPKTENHIIAFVIIRF